MSTAVQVKRIGKTAAKISAKMLLVLARVFLRHLVLPLLHRYGKQTALIGLGLFLVFHAPEVLGIIIACVFIVFAIKRAGRRR